MKFDSNVFVEVKANECFEVEQESDGLLPAI